MSLLILIGRGLDLKIEKSQVRPKGKLKKETGLMQDEESLDVRFSGYETLREFR